MRESQVSDRGFHQKRPAPETLCTEFAAGNRQHNLCRIPQRGIEVETRNAGATGSTGGGACVHREICVIAECESMRKVMSHVVKRANRGAVQRTQPKRIHRRLYGGESVRVRAAARLRRRVRK